MKNLALSIFMAIYLATTAVVAAQPSDSQQQEFSAAMQEAKKVLKTGPVEIDLLDQAKLKLPQNFAYIPQPEAGKVMRAMGNRDNPAMIGIIFPTNDANWFVSIKYINSGYIKDDEAKSWNIDEMLQRIKDGTEEANKERKERGFPETEIIGWIEKPQYNDVRKHLVWSISARDKGDTSTDANHQTVNYNTYVLGREGFLNLTLVTSLHDVEADKAVAAELLAASEFVSGKKYADFNSSTDHIAEFGLATLVAGVAAKKLGLFAILAGFILKFAKVIGVAIIAFGGILTKLWRKKKEARDEGPPFQS